MTDAGPEAGDRDFRTGAERRLPGPRRGGARPAGPDAATAPEQPDAADRRAGSRRSAGSDRLRSAALRRSAGPSAIVAAQLVVFAALVLDRGSPTDPPVLGLVAVGTAGLCAAAAWRTRGRRSAALTWAVLALVHLAATVLRDHLLASAAPLTHLAALPGIAVYPVALFAAVAATVGEDLGQNDAEGDDAARWSPARWADALVVGLTTASIGGATAAVVGSAAPAAGPDIALSAAAAFLAALAGRRAAESSWWLTAAIASITVAELSAGTSADAARVLGITLVGVTALRSGRTPPPTEPRPGDRARLRLRPLPAVAAGLATALVTAQVIGVRITGAAIPPGPAVLAIAAVCAALVRAAASMRALTGAPQASDASRTDELTGLANRQALSEALTGEAISGPAIPGGPRAAWSGWADRIALLLVDLDGFKEINEALGHEAGDQVLAVVGTRFASTLRAPQLLARLGGDEFAVLLPGAGRVPATRVAQALAIVLTEPIQVDHTRIHVRASVGVATCELPHDEPGDLLRRADVALHHAKAEGSGLEVYDQAWDVRTAQRLRRIDELRSALERGDLEVYLQPQVDLASGVVIGAEALARWRHPSDGVLLPDSFLPLAAQTGLMRPVAALVLERALAACAQWWSRGFAVPVSVNLTPDDLRDTALPERIMTCLERHHLPTAALCIEITENLLMTDPESASVLLAEWRRAGIAVALDDYGTGYSSLAYLRELPLDKLKLDRVFVADLQRARTATIVRHTVAMAHGLGLEVIAEGIEDVPTARDLAEAGCDVGQGLYFGAAMDLTAFLDQLKSPRPWAIRG